MEQYRGRRRDPDPRGARRGPVWSEWPQNRKRDHPQHGTSRISEVKAPYGTPRPHRAKIRLSTGKFHAATSDDKGWALSGADAFLHINARAYVTILQSERALTPSDATPVRKLRNGFHDAMPGAVADAAITTCAKSSLLLYCETNAGYKHGRGRHCNVLMPTAMRSWPSDRWSDDGRCSSSSVRSICDSRIESID